MAISEPDAALSSPKARSLRDYNDKVARMKAKLSKGGAPQKKAPAVEEPQGFAEDVFDAEDVYENERRVIKEHTSSVPDAGMMANAVEAAVNAILSKINIPSLRAPEVQEVKQQVPTDPGYIKINNEHVKIALTYPIDQSKFRDGANVQPLTLSLHAYHVDVNEDAITVVTDNNVDFKLPKLEQILIEYENVQWVVFWAGGQSSFGNLKYTSFLISEKKS